MLGYTIEKQAYIVNKNIISLMSHQNSIKEYLCSNNYKMLVKVNVEKSTIEANLYKKCKKVLFNFGLNPFTKMALVYQEKKEYDIKYDSKILHKKADSIKDSIINKYNLKIL